MGVGKPGRSMAGRVDKKLNHLFRFRLRFGHTLRAEV